MNEYIVKYGSEEFRLDCKEVKQNVIKLIKNSEPLCGISVSTLEGASVSLLIEMFNSAENYVLGVKCKEHDPDSEFVDLMKTLNPQVTIKECKNEISL